MDTNLALQARAVIGERTPLKSDCGALCGAACCQADEDGQGGMYLFPGEEALLPGEGGDFAPIYTCGGVCRREERPLACRIFPLTPVRKENIWGVKIDRRARAMCPLARFGTRALDPEFVRAVRRAVRLVAADPEGAAFLEKWAAREAEYELF
ncbi:MAG TPA: hypothetical protein IAA75_01115 [Candidatus Pullichristensenella avicola]|nr:hypothetical protein [Candidatus Pullichristensenella avicola]